MTIALLILAMIIGYLRRGKLRNLAYLEIKLVPMIIFAFIIQMIIYFGYRFDIEIIQSYDILLHFVSYIILFAGLMGNLDSKWFIMITIGVVCNFMVIFLNGGKMPVSFEAATNIGISANNINALLSVRAGTHQELEVGALLWFLADIIPVSFPEPLKFFGNIYSIGDVILQVGMMGLIQSAMVQHPKNEENEELLLEETASVGEFKSFKTQNHIDDIYIKDHDEKDCSSLIQEETIVFNFEQADNYEVAAMDIEEKTGLKNEIEGSKDVYDNDGQDKIFNLNDTSILYSENEHIQTHELFFERNNESNKNDGSNETNESNGTDQNEDIQESQKFYKDEPLEEEIQPEPKMSNEVEFDDGIVDTTHQFIIVDGKIKENLNYNKNQANNSSEMPVEEIENRVNKLEEQVEELEMTQVELKPKKDGEGTNNQHVLQNITDNERVDLMKQMKQRKEKGYSLVEVEVGSKKINFWKKDLQ